ncbi:hypothetical protein [Leptospira alexanderi]|uniref:hypothetical protein n=1 Tax=Leptospira alexanderi TaxID=100053 RepID=UPI000990A3C8|nr:hypothetical protein [Leptospira alexanderi]
MNHSTYNNLEKSLQNPSEVKILDLSSQELEILPEEIGSLQNLKELYLQDFNSFSEKERIRKLLPKCEIFFEPASKLSESFKIFVHSRILSRFWDKS